MLDRIVLVNGSEVSSFSDSRRKGDGESMKKLSSDST